MSAAAAIVLPLAHLGHVIVDLPLFGGPGILLALGVSAATARADRRAGDEDAAVAEAERGAAA
jgi:hypothetical protein